MPLANRRRWTEEDLAKLRSMAGKCSSQQIAIERDGRRRGPTRPLSGTTSVSSDLVFGGARRTYQCLKQNVF